MTLDRCNGIAIHWTQRQARRNGWLSEVSNTFQELFVAVFNFSQQMFCSHVLNKVIAAPGGHLCAVGAGKIRLTFNVRILCLKGCL